MNTTPMLNDIETAMIAAGATSAKVTLQDGDGLTCKLTAAFSVGTIDKVMRVELDKRRLSFRTLAEISASLVRKTKNI